MDKFYIIDLVGSTFASFWKESARGRTYDVRKAGIFTKEEVRRYSHNPELLFVPVDTIDLEASTVLAVWNETAKFHSKSWGELQQVK